MTRPKLRVVPDAPQQAKPILKWAGGKSWFVKDFGDDLFEHVLKCGGSFIEPFLGGAAMALHLGLPNMILGDAEEELIETYATIRSKTGDVAALLSLMDDLGTDRESYDRVKETPAHTEVERAAKFIYLNHTCFNGLYRKNKSGEFNVPWGGEGRRLPDVERLYAVADAIRKSTLLAADFQYVISQAGKGDVIYADPPYHGTYSDYTSKGFGDDDHRRLADALAKAYSRGAEFILHNSDTPLIRELYDGLEIAVMPEKRRINSDGEKRGPVECLLITARQE